MPKCSLHPTDEIKTNGFGDPYCKACYDAAPMPSCDSPSCIGGECQYECEREDKSRMYHGTTYLD